MDIMNPKDDQFLQLAISTVFHLNKDQFHLHMDDLGKENFIKQMSSEIILRAQRFKLLTASIETL